MKKKAYIILLSVIVLAFFMFASCNDFLSNQKPNEFTSTSKFYKNKSQMQQAVNGAYSKLQDLYGADGDMYWIAEIRSDNTTFQYDPSDRGSLENEKADYFELTNSSPIPLNLWEGMYNGIAQCNTTLDHVDDADLSDADKSKIVGQLKFVRALLYFNLVRIFGHIPLVTKPATTPKEAFSAGSVSSDTVYTQIIQDATDAVNDLPASWSGDQTGRATKGAANTLLGLVQMTLHHWGKAHDALQKVVEGDEYSLVPDYASLYNPSSQYNSESIFQVGFDESVDGEASSFIYRYAPYNSGSDIVGFNDLSPSGAGFNIPTHSMVKSYKYGDKRKKASITWYVKSDNSDWGVAFHDSIPYINKYAAPPVSPGEQNVNIYIYRYAQVLLWYAETINEQNGPGKAYQYINEVRDRAGLSPLSGLSKDQFRDAVYHEERVEGAFENHRWFQLLRTGRATDAMKKEGNKARIYQGYWLPQDAYDIQEYKLLLPIPHREVRLNHLEQNPGW